MNNNQHNKQLVWSFWQSLQAADEDALADVAGQYLADDVHWQGPDPVNDLMGPTAFVEQFWKPLLASIPDLTRQTHIFMGGRSNGRIDGDISKDNHWWVSGTGYLNGTFESDYLAIPANGKKVSVRWGEFCRVEDGKIVEIFFLLDLIDLMQQAGFNVLPLARGKDHLYPAPVAGDGLLHESQPDDISDYSLQHIRRFIFDGLNNYDQSDLSSMGMADFFHPDVKWYGPGGIGACLSFEEFESLHQAPWLIAYPDRSVQDLDALIAEGMYSAAPGWAGVIATHTGPYLDVPATNKQVKFNGLDWWKRDGEVYIENWVFVDLIHLFRQFGVDLFERLEQLRGKTG
jgi:predicted ester cyclase